MPIKDEQLKNFLSNAGLISKSAFDKAAAEAAEKHVSVRSILVSNGTVSEDEIRRIEAQILGIPFISLKGQKIDFEILSLIPEPVARNHNIIAYKKSDGALEVAMLNVDDLAAIDFVKKKVGLKILPRLTDTASVRSALLQYQKTLKDEFGDIIRREARSLSEISEGEIEIGDEATVGDLKKLAENLPVVRIVDALLKHAIIQNASDIHIEPLEEEVLVRYRIDGILHDAMTLPKSASSSIIARIKVLSSLKLDEKRLPQDGRFKMEVYNERVSFRVSILPTYFGEKAVMRLLKENVSGFTLEGLGFHGEALERIHRALREKTGMILTTGPTGSGKTTTLYTMLDILNTPDVNISTIEDPIEYQMDRVNQTQVKPDIGFSFANGLRALVRQDPDIVMVGEIRDNETAGLAINAALTGHLVFSTLHTNSAAGAIPRLLDMEAEPFLLVSTLNVVLGQRLVRRLCEEKDEYTLTTADIKALEKNVDLERVLEELKKENVVDNNATWRTIPVYKPKESAECPDGYSGRIGIHEILPVTPSITKLIMEGATADTVEKQARSEGMLTMIEDGMYKVAQGITTIEEVLRVINE